MTGMINLAGVTKAFGAKQVLQGVDLNIEKGQSVVVIGGSGSGKSVMLKSILGLLTPDDGTIHVDGTQTVSFWLPLDPVTTETTLRLVAGSHRWEKDVLPVRWLKGDDFYPDAADYLPVPDPDSDPDRYDVLEWGLEPGDAIAFHFGVVHGARGNPGAGRRRAFSLRLVGDDARYVSRPGRTSPPFPDHGMVDGDRLRFDWFPELIGSTS